jgi:HTH-type transcriptional regulator / antitoxin HigA
MAKKMIRPIRTETEYDETLREIERYFENEPKPGTSEDECCALSGLAGVAS